MWTSSSRNLVFLPFHRQGTKTSVMVGIDEIALFEPGPTGYCSKITLQSGLDFLVEETFEQCKKLISGADPG